MSLATKIAKFYLFLFLWGVLAQASAVTLVRMETVMGNIDIELYDDITPNTVANFLGYATTGAYDNTFIHRSAPGFVIQGGGYTLSGEQAQHIPENAPVINEFSKSNLRGTLAMAKLAGDPDSATSEWFFNLADNSGTLDTQNGGFTVFGRVLGDGMDVVDAIAALPRINAGGVLSQLPVRNYAGGTLLAENYVFLNQVILPRVALLPAVMDFGNVGLEYAKEADVRVLNQGVDPLTLGQVAGLDSLAAPFSIVSDTCSSQVLAAGDVCVVRIRFTPTVLGEVSESFDIPSDDADTPSVHVQLRGTGYHPLSLAPADRLQLGGVALGMSATQSLTLENVGGVDLTLYAISLSGADQQEFTLDQGAGCSVLAPAATCEVQVTLTPQTEGVKSAQLDIETDFMEQPKVSLPVVGSGQVPNILLSARALDIGDTLLGGKGGKSLELLNSGSGDLVVSGADITGADAADFQITSNSCSSLAQLQQCSIGIEFHPQRTGPHTATLVVNSNDPDKPASEATLTGFGRDAWNEVTLETGSGSVRLVAPINTALLDVARIDIPSPEQLPADFSFDHGAYQFNVQLASAGSRVAVLLAFPAGVEPTTYYMYGATPDNAVPHWYEFLWDGNTGAVFQENVVTLYFQDGKRGDSDLQADGVIVDPGTPGVARSVATNSTSGSSGGGGGGCVLGTGNGGLGAALEWLMVIGFVAVLGWRQRLQ